MQVANAPLKWLVPWAQQNTNIFELPETTSDPTRASQSLGFPPQTMLPPESGGVPPQGIDYNAGLYQVARITWWLMYGAPFVYDSTFATNALISGYTQGAEVSSSDYLGKWRSTADNNQAAPDTTGTNWIPAQMYGSTTTALTNTNVTLTPLQAAKKTLVFTGTLTGNVVVTLPAWIYDWTAVNNCSGAFTLTLTTSGGAGAVVPQGGSTRLRGDGTNILLDAPNVPNGTSSSNAASIAIVQKDSANYAVDTGAANACVVALSPAVTALSDGLPVVFKVATTNTTATTLNLNGLGASPVVSATGAALDGNELTVGCIASVVWNASLSSWQLQASGEPGRLLNIQTFTATGTYTRTPGARNGIIRQVGGGGGGGGCPSTSASQQATAGGGASGAYAEAFVALPATAAVTIGAAGTGGASGSNAGTAGGTTSFGSLLSCPGGTGGSAGTASGFNSQVFAANNDATLPTGFNIVGFPGLRNGKAQSVLGISSGQVLGADGGSCPFGIGGTGGSGAPGNNAIGNGSGGGGCSQFASEAGSAGGNGAAGKCVVYEYA